PLGAGAGRHGRAVHGEVLERRTRRRIRAHRSQRLQSVRVAAARALPVSSVAVAAASGHEPGFYGKLPSRGDFVSRRLPQPFVATWDAWLQQGIAASQAALGQRWLDVYLTSPIWRFALAPQVCGGAAYIGVLVPSVDRVGRYFPLTAALALPKGVAP